MIENQFKLKILDLIGQGKYQELFYLLMDLKLMKEFKFI
jgi:hypothetical protein